MDKFKKFLFSMPFGGFLLLFFAVAIATATFIENDFGTEAAKAVVYNARWFEILLFIMSINLAGNIITNKLYTKNKLPNFLFHFSFLIIILGSAVTRYIGYEGVMHIREGESANFILSTDTYLSMKVECLNEKYEVERRLLLSPMKSNDFSKHVRFVGNDTHVELKQFYPNASESITESTEGEPIISFMLADMNNTKRSFLKTNSEKEVIGSNLSFNKKNTNADLQIFSEGEKLFFKSPFEVIKEDMTRAGLRDTLAADSLYPMAIRTLYLFDNQRIVISKFLEKAKMKLSAGRAKSMGNGLNALVFEVSNNQVKKEMVVWGGNGIAATPERLNIGEVSYEIAYGSKKIELPFSLQLDDFQMERYPGSNSPSSYASEVSLHDEANQISEKYRIFMNNVLKYQGFRFYQSSYDRDEKGTILSVNHDAAGTFITYVGYFLMTLGMILTLFSKHSRFRILSRSKTSVKKALPAILLFFSILHHTSPVQATEVPQNLLQKSVSKEHAARFGNLLVQDNGGRLKPINTLSAELLRKVSRKSSLSGLNPDQVLLGMAINPHEWQSVKMIKIAHPKMKNLLKTDKKYASYRDFFNLNTGTYILAQLVENAYAKRPAERGTWEKELIKVDEKINICYLIYSGSFLQIFPLKDDANNKWYNSQNYQKFQSEDSVFVKSMLPLYYQSLEAAIKTGDMSQADKNLTYLREFQQKYAGDILPAQRRIKMEMLYNRLSIFKRLFMYLGLLGFIMLIFNFITVFNPAKKFSTLNLIFIILLWVGFAAQTFGLILRWYISEHAPWSNGYESMIYIAWATLLSGLIFSRRSKITLSATAVLASIILMVAHLNWMDPEITNLVPVLKSYWLTVHVAVITASYGFLGLSMILSFLNLLFLNFLSKKNQLNLNRVIGELTIIIEKNITIGLFFLTIGTFLGGVWANESWGRYWGWDAKETWSLVTVLIYAFVAHMRLIPGLRGRFAFNFASLISFAAVLMTYFGVNFYLSGLHSYASGDPVPIPRFVYYSVAVILVVALTAFINEQKMKKLNTGSDLELDS